MKVFITGGTGNIGQYVTLEVLKRGHEAVVLSRSPEKYPTLAAMKNVTLVGGLITDYDLMGRLIKDCDAIIHIALGWGDEPISMLLMDTEATVHLLEMAEKAGVKKFMYTSSTAAMGEMRPVMNETVMNLPLDLYGSTKSASEAFVLGFRAYYGAERTGGNSVAMKRNVIRPGYTFSNPPYPDGSSQSDTRFRDIADAAVKNETVRLTLHDGTQFLSSGQIAQLYADLLESDQNEQVFLALSSDFTTWERVAQIALEEYPQSASTIACIDKGWNPAPNLYQVAKIKDVFGLDFHGEEEIRAHVRWNLQKAAERIR